MRFSAAPLALEKTMRVTAIRYRKFAERLRDWEAHSTSYVVNIALEDHGTRALSVPRLNVNAVVITGGMANSERLVNELRDCVEWIAPVMVFPGEDELQALAEGALRVLRGEEEVRELA